MNIELYLAFLAVSVVIIIVPGPNVTLILTTGATRGMRAGLAIVAGTTLAQILQVIAVALGLAWLVGAYGDLFDLLRYAGAAYLIYLGIQAWRKAGDPLPARKAVTANVKRGFLVGLANPKTLAFFAAFFPQFIDLSMPYGPQFTVLAVSYLLLAAILDSAYAFAGGMGRRLLATERSGLILGRASGVVLAGGGLWLASLRRS